MKKVYEQLVVITLICSTFFIMIITLWPSRCLGWGSESYKDIDGVDSAHYFIIDKAIQYIRDKGLLSQWSLEAYQPFIRYGAYWADFPYYPVKLECDWAGFYTGTCDGLHHYASGNCLELTDSGGLCIGDGDGLGAPAYGQTLYDLAIQFWPGGAPVPDIHQLPYRSSAGYMTTLFDGRELGPFVVGGHPFAYEIACEQTKEECPSGEWCLCFADWAYYWPGFTYDGYLLHFCKTDPCMAFPISRFSYDAGYLSPFIASESIRSSLIYLGWAIHMVEDMSMPDHALDKTGSPHKDFEERADQLIQSGDMSRLPISTDSSYASQYISVRSDFFNNEWSILEFARQSARLSKEAKYVPGSDILGIPEDHQIEIDLDTSIKMIAGVIYKFFSELELPQDIFEPNNSDLSAVSLGTGFYENLTVHAPDDVDFYEVIVPEDYSRIRIAVNYDLSKYGNELAVNMRYTDCDIEPCGWGEPGFEITDTGRIYEEELVPAGRRYVIEVSGFGYVPVPYSMNVYIGSGELPPDSNDAQIDTVNDSPEAATEFTGAGRCIYSSSLNIHNASDIDYYKIEALGYSVETHISFDPSMGELQLFLCDGLQTCTEATDVSVSGSTKTLSITGCGTSPSYVRVQGQPNYYDVCVRTVPLEAGCPNYIPGTTFAGSGAFDYRIANQFSPGYVNIHGDVRPNLSVRLTDETDSSYIWTVHGWIGYPTGLGQPFTGNLTIPKGATPGSSVPFTVHMPQMLAAGLREWYQVEGECTAGNTAIFNCNANSQCDSSAGSGDGVCTPVQAGSAQFQGAGNAITSFSAETVVDGLFWHLSKPDDRGTLVVEGGLDTDGDGILDDVESATGTNPDSDDTDNDGIPDGAEDVDHDGQVDSVSGETDPRLWDTDSDGVSDGVENGLTSPQGNDTDPNIFRADEDPATTTDPNRADTDGDGMPDGIEDANQNGSVDPGETSPLIRDVTGPDLTVESMMHVPSNPTTMDTITFTAVVKNIGDDSSDPSTLNFKIGGETFGQDFPIPALTPNASIAVERQLRLSVAQNYLNRATADVNNDVNESDETNNIAADGYAVTLAGDLDGDGDVDLDDVNTFREALGSEEGDANYNPDADFDRDGRITMNDYRILRRLYAGGT